MTWIVSHDVVPFDWFIGHSWWTCESGFSVPLAEDAHTGRLFPALLRFLTPTNRSEIRADPVAGIAN
jgi:hypothetical protein